ncbi:hypothetical protein GCM10011316_08580 [Roseibium aquae]|uniref:Uncharacterized protein n=1 Tax=Roseibium aquae TaxID=1323746 RepID=A0A916WY22_9HYPH|nr:hypothetical protein [Roseibium aquae]GGB38814.1 hypothetical protein GCM10011316_08580 [Roseibium aquae]
MRSRGLKHLAAGALAIATTLAGLAGAQAESPFHTGVWQLDTAEGPRGLVVSDWLVFEEGLPKRWLYRRAGTNDENQFDFFTRTIGDNRYTPVGIRVYRTGEHTMKYTLAEKGKDPIEVSGQRLSIPNYKNSCLSVENKGDRLFGAWVGTEASSVKGLRLTASSLTVDGVKTDVTAEQVRVGRAGIAQNGKPIAFLTDAGGDYAVLQWFNDGVTLDQMRDTKREILDFKAEEILRWPQGTCDRQIASRLKAMK